MKKCECCGRMFKPATMEQRFCSLICAEDKLAQKETIQAALEPIKNVANADYLTFSNAAVLMGCSRQYIYKLVAQGKLTASRISSRMSFVRRADIEAMLAANPYHRVIPIGLSQSTSVGVKKNSDPTPSSDTHAESSFTVDDYFTIEQAVEKYGVSTTTIYNRVRLHSVPTCRMSGKTYYSKTRLEEVFLNYTKTDQPKGEVVITEDNIEWLTYKDAAAYFDRSYASVKNLVYLYDIPTRMINGKKHCSKTHIEQHYATSQQNAEIEDYYSVSQMYSLFGISKNIVMTYARRNQISVLNVNRRNFFLKKDVERARKSPK